MKPRLIFHLVLALLNFPRTIISGQASTASVSTIESPWFFIGCLRGNTPGVNLEVNDQGTPTSPQGCVRKCQQQGSELALLYRGGLCHCKFEVPDDLQDPTSSEKECYAGNDDATELSASRCFQDDQAQVFFITKFKVRELGLQVPRQVEVDHSVDIKLILTLENQDKEQTEVRKSNKKDNDEGIPRSKLATAAAGSSNESIVVRRDLSFSCLFHIGDGRSNGHRPERTSPARIAPVHDARRRLYINSDSHVENQNATKSESSSRPDPLYPYYPTDKLRTPGKSSVKQPADFSTLRRRNVSAFVAECSWRVQFPEEGNFTFDASLWCCGGKAGRFGWRQKLVRTVTVRRTPSLFPGDLGLAAKPWLNPQDRRNGTTPKCVPTLLKHGPLVYQTDDDGKDDATRDVDDQTEGGTLLLVFTKIPFDLLATLARGTARRFLWTFINVETFQRATPKDFLCPSINCSTDSLKYEFEKEGIFIVELSVTTAKETVSKNFTLVAVDHRLTNLRFVLAANSSLRIKPNSDVDFLLSVDTTDAPRLNADFYFGDGSSWNGNVVTMVGDRTSNCPAYSVDYGQTGCRLSFKIRHRYQSEGIYHPRVVFFDGRERLEGQLSTALSVCDSLEGVGLTGTHIVAAGSKSTFSLLVRESNCSLSTKWSLSNRTTVLKQTRSTFLWELEFSDVADYVVVAEVRNAVSSSSANFHLSVVETISGLYLLFEPIKDVYKTWDSFIVYGRFATGSDSTCTWNLSGNEKTEDVVEEISNCSARLTFTQPGSYRVCLTVRNILNHQEICSGNITVQEAILSLEVLVESVRNEIEIHGVLSTDHAGVGIKVTTNVGHSEQLWLQSSRFVVNLQRFNVAETNLTLSVTARNDVSEIKTVRQLTILAKNVIEVFRVEPVGCVVVGQPAIVAVYFNDGKEPELSSKPYVFKWSVSGLPRSTTSLPFISWVPLKDGAVNVRVSVLLNELEKRSRITVKISKDEPKLCVWNQLINQPNANTTVIIRKPPGNVTAFFVSLQNLTSGRTIVETSLPVLDSENIVRWKRVLESPGTVLVRVGCFSDRKGQLNQSSPLVVLRAVNSLVIRGPKGVRLSRLPVVVNYTAATEDSPGLLYKWKLDDQPEIVQASPILQQRFVEAGNHSLRVKVRNISGQTWSSSLVISVVEAFRSLKVEYRQQKRPLDFAKLNFSLTIEGACDQYFVARLKFGDGIEGKIVAGSGTESKGLSRYVLKTNHRYKSHGRYHVAVNVSSPAGWIARSLRVMVEEPVGSVRCFLRSPSLVSLFQNVETVATVPRGMTVVWDFGDGTEGEFTHVRIEGNLSYATHSYSKSGTYSVKALIKNRNIETSVKPDVTVVERIQRLQFFTRPAKIVAVPLISGLTDNVSFVVTFWRGSNVTFNVSFDDGNFLIHKPETNAFPITTSVFNHRYNKEGVFKPNVLAINPLGNERTYINQEIRVLAPPEGLTLTKPFHVVVKHRKIEIEAVIASGTNVTYDWFLGDSCFLTNAGSRVNVSFGRTGTHEVSVEAYNAVTDHGVDGEVKRPLAKTRVIVQDILRDIRICLIRENSYESCEGVDVVLPLEEKMAIVAKVNPPSDIDSFTWNLGNSVPKKSGSPRLELIYNKPGRYSLSVIVDNRVSLASSGVLKLHLIQKLMNLTSIKHNGTFLVDSNATFHALFWHGSDLSFLWDFGDASKVEEGQSTIQHIFQKTGEYFVTVTAWNLFSRANLTTNVFILDQPCPKPVIEIVEQCRNQIVSSFQDVKIEIDITVTCDSDLPVIFLWTVHKNGALVEIHPNVSSSRNFYQPFGFEEGIYNVSVKVNIPETIVYSEVFSVFSVEPKPLVARLKGGLMRRSGRGDRVVFDGSDTLRPDGNDSNTKFDWLCRGLRVASRSCFRNTTRNLKSVSGSNFTALGKDFDPEVNQFLVTVTVTDGNRNSSASSVVEILTEPNFLEVEVSCLNCVNNEVPNSWPIKLQAVCLENQDLVYDWKLWLLEDGFHDIISDTYDCSMSSISAHNLIEDQIQSMAENSLPEISVSFLGNFSSEFSYPIDNAVFKRREHRRPRSSENLKIITSYNAPVEDLSTHIDSKERAYHAHPHLSQPKEGTPGEGGSALPREQNVDKIGKNDVSDTGGSSSGDKTDVDKRVKVIDGFSNSNEIPHMLLRPRQLLELFQNETTTGLNSKYLVIKEGILKPSATYIVEVNVRDKRSKMGFAMEYFKIAPGPSEGRCTVAPAEGVALKTQFRLHCLEWKSERYPLTYTLHYSTHPDDPKYPIYSGLNPNVKFYLPSGSERRNYTLILHLKIRDNFGSELKVCQIDTRVIESIEANPWDGGVVTSYELKRLNRELNNQGALSYLLMSAGKRMNQLRFVKDILRALMQIELQNKFQALQCLATLKLLINDKTLTANEIEMATTLLGNSIQTIEDFDLDRESSTFVLSTLSSLTWFICNLDWSDDWRLREVIINSRDHLLKLLDHLVNVKSLLIEEDPVELVSPRLSLTYGFLSSSGLPARMKAGSVSLTFQSLNKNGCNSLVTNKYFEFNIYGSNSDSRRPNKIVITNVSNENGTEAIHKEFIVEFKRNATATTENTSVLKSNFLNVHRFNLTTDFTNQSLSISVRLNAVVEDPIVVMFGLSSDIRPGAQLLSKIIPRSQVSVNIFIPPGLMKHDSKPHIILAHAKYANGEIDRESGDINRIAYQVSVFGQACLSRVDETWTSSVCQVLENTDEYSVSCKCFSTYAVGLVTWSPVLELEEESFEQILGYGYNPTALVFFACLFLVFLVLWRITYPLDRRNAQHCLLNELKDNKPWEMYHYLVSIRTGPFLEAGTTASVYLVLHGDRGYSPAKCLSTPTTFQRSSRDNFFFSTEKGLGKIWKVQLWHNNSGSSPSWFLQDLTVVDLINGIHYKFNCEKWFSVEEDDCLVEREILAEENAPTFIKVFHKTLSYVLPNHHLWTSVISAPSWSVFSHTQRLTCCLSTICTSSGLSAFGTKFLSIPNQDIVSGIPWQSVVLSVLASFISFILHSQLIGATRHVRYRKPSLFVQCRAPLVDCLWCSWWWCLLRAKRTSQGGSGSTSSPSILMDDLIDSDSEYQEGTESESDYNRSEDFVDDIELTEFSRRSIQYPYLRTSNQLHDTNMGLYQRHFSDSASLGSRQTSSGFQDWLPESNDDKSPVLEDQNEIDDPKRLPQYFLYFSWALMSTTIFVSTFISLQWIKSFNSFQVFFWLSSLVLAVVCDVVLWQPLLVITITAVASFRSFFSNDNWTVDCWSKALKTALRKAKRSPYVEETSYSLPRPSHFLYYNRPPVEQKLILAREKAAKYRVTSLFLSSFIWSLLISILLTTLIIGDLPSDYIEQRQSIRNFITHATKYQIGNFSDWLHCCSLGLPSFLKDLPINTNSEIIGQVRLKINDSFPLTNHKLNISLEFGNVNTSDLEFNLFNPSVNLLSYVSLQFRFPILNSSLRQDISVTRVKFTRTYHLCFQLVEVLLVSVIFWLIKLEFWRILKIGKSFWCQFSNNVKILFCVLGCSYFVCLIYQSYISETTFIAFKERNTSINVNRLEFCDWLRRSLRGSLLFVHLISSYSFLRFHPLFKNSVRTLVLVWKKLLALLVIWLFVLTGLTITKGLVVNESEGSGSTLSMAIQLLNFKNRKDTEIHHWASLIYVIAVTITFFIMGFIRAALINAKRKSRSKEVTRRFSKKTAMDIFRGGLCQRKAATYLFRNESAKLPLEFLLFQLDTMVNEMIDRANKLFAMSLLDEEYEISKELNFEPLESELNQVRSKRRSTCINKYLTDLVKITTETDIYESLSSQNSCPTYRVRKTYPLQLTTSLHESTCSSIGTPKWDGLLTNASLRKTKSKGKGKNGNLQMPFAISNYSSDS